MAHYGVIILYLVVTLAGGYGLFRAIMAFFDYSDDWWERVEKAEFIDKRHYSTLIFLVVTIVILGLEWRNHM